MAGSVPQRCQAHPKLATPVKICGSADRQIGATDIVRAADAAISSKLGGYHGRDFAGCRYLSSLLGPADASRPSGTGEEALDDWDRAMPVERCVVQSVPT